MKSQIILIIRSACILMIAVLGFAFSEEQLKKRISEEFLESEQPIEEKRKKSKRFSRTPASVSQELSGSSMGSSSNANNSSSSNSQSRNDFAGTEDSPDSATTVNPEIPAKVDQEEPSLNRFTNASINGSFVDSNENLVLAKPAALAPGQFAPATAGFGNKAAVAPTVENSSSVVTSSGSSSSATPAVIMPSISISDASVIEGGVASVTVSLSTIPTSTVIFNWATADGTADSIADYVSGSSSVVIVPPATSATIMINSRADASLCEGDKIFNVNLSSVSGALVSDSSAAVTVAEDDFPTVDFQAATSNGTEGTSLAVNAQLSVVCPTKSLTFQISTTDGTAISATASSDFTAHAASSHTITAGSTTTNVQVVTANDSRDEVDEDLTLTISSLEIGLSAQTTHILTVNDNDAAPTLSVPALVTVTEGSGAGITNATYTVTLAAVSDKTVTVDYATADASSGYIATTAGSDYTGTTGTATIAAGNLTTTFSIPIGRDALDEYDERFDVTLSGGSNYNAAGSVLLSQVEITDDDSSPTISISTPVSVSESAGTASFTVSLSAVSGRAVTFDFNTANSSATAGSDYTAISSDNLSIAAGSTTRVVTVPITDDGTGCESDETFTSTLSDLVNAGAGTDLISTTTITENDFPSLSLSSDTVTEGSNASLTATLSYLCLQPVTFKYNAFSNSAILGDDFPAASGTVTIPASTLTSAPIIVATTDDSLSEVEENFFVTTYDLTQSVNTAGSIGIVTVSDNEVATKVTKVAVSINTSCALSNTGEVKCWGNNENGQLGIAIEHRGDEAGEMGDTLSFLDFGDNAGTPYTVKKIVRGSYHTCAILSNDRLKCWGKSHYFGQLGLETETHWGDSYGETGNGLPFVNLGTDGGGLPHLVTDVALSEHNTCALLANQQVKCWGNGQTGINGSASLIGRYSGEMGNSLGFMDLGGSNKVLAISAGFRHVCALLDDEIGPAGDGDVKCWGQNWNYGVLGANNNTDTPSAPGGFGNNLPYVNLGTGVKALSVVAGLHYSCAIVEDNVATAGGFMKCWGANGDGQLGIDSRESLGNGYADAAPLIPVDEMGDNLPYTFIGAGKKATSVHLGGNTTCAILDDDGDVTNGGDLKCWGNNTYGTTGRGSSGFADYGGEPGEMAAIANVNLGTGLKAFDVSPTMNTTCVLVDDDSNLANGRGLKCWGSTQFGALGDPFSAEVDKIIGNTPATMGDALPFVNLGTGTALNIASLASGCNSTTFGSVTKQNHCALTSDDKVKCWGEDSAGQLLQGIMHIGDGPGEMGLSLASVDLGTGVTALDIGLGESFSCALTDSYQVKCWGAGGQLGIGYNEAFSVGDEVDEMGDNLQAINFGPGRSVLSLAVSPWHACAILDNFETKCWGQGYYKNFLGVVTGINTANMATVPAFNFGTGRYAIQIGKTYYNGACAILDNLKIKCWGENADGQLLQDTTVTSFGSTAVQDGDDLPYLDLGTNLLFAKVLSGNGASCALTTAGNLKCWGNQSNGRLASGQTTAGSFGTNIGDIAVERGNSLPIVDFNGDLVKDFAFNSHGCAIVGATRELKCWGVQDGFGGNGQGTLGGIGWGDALTEVGASFSSVAVGSGVLAIDRANGSHTCAIMNDFSVKCWGLNGFGQLGLGNVNTIGDINGEIAALTTIDLGF